MCSFFREREREIEKETDVREISIGKNKEYKRKKSFIWMFKNNPQKDKQSKNVVKRKR